MSCELQKIFNKYCEKYPLYTQEAVVDQMVEDGIITNDIAEKIKSGVSLFLLDIEFRVQENNNSDYKEIFGWYPDSDKDEPQEINFNREIEPTEQAEGSIDCWLLSGVNALNTTEWGKTVLYNAIEPDGEGGVTIRLPGSPIPQKNFHITSDEIAAADKSGQYSFGDQDMLAIELAVEKLFKIMDENKIGEIDRNGADTDSYLGNMIMDGRYTLDVERLLTGRETKSFANTAKGIKAQEFNKTYKYLSDNLENYAVTVTFSSRPDAFGYRDKNDPVHGNHSYCLKEMVYGKYVILSDPYDSGTDIKMDWQRFISDECLVLFCTAKDENSDIKLEEALPENLRKIEQESVEKRQREKAEAEALETAEKQKSEKQKFDSEQEDAWQDIITTFGEDGKRKLDDWNPSKPKINKYNVIKFFDKYGVEIIAKVDHDVRGWGYGKAKKCYILPMIEALAEFAKDKGVSRQEIMDFQNKCNKELDAWFYTDEKVIMQEVQKMLHLVRQKQN